MAGKLIIKFDWTYADKAAYDASYSDVNSFMDSKSGYAEMIPNMSTDDTSLEVYTNITLTFPSIDRTTMDTRLTQLQGASGLFPGASASCRYYETVVVDMP